jgi:DNA-directed RNA polymerase subunit beta'
MFKKVRIVNGSASTLLEDELVEKRIVEDENAILVAEGKPEILWEPVIQGITKAAVNTESFLSAASFQETTKVLANAAIQGKVDNLLGLKENVIIGKRIPAGTGFVAYDKIKINVPKEVVLEEVEAIENPELTETTNVVEEI